MCANMHVYVYMHVCFVCISTEQVEKKTNRKYILKLRKEIHH